MCDYSLQNVKTRDAVVGDKLIVKNFGTGTRGFAPAGQPADQEPVAVCLLPGTELAFDEEIKTGAFYMFTESTPRGSNVARFTQVSKETAFTHHDALQLPEKGDEVIMLNCLVEGQQATVLQLPAVPKTKEEAEAQKRLPVNA